MNRTEMNVSTGELKNIPFVGAELDAWTAANAAYAAGADTRKAAEVRAERNTKLAKTDWTQGADTPQAIKAKYVPYRQALRDVPAQAGFPNTVVWPTQPE